MTDDISTIWLRLSGMQFQYLVPYFMLLLGHFIAEPLRWTVYLRFLPQARPTTLFHLFNLGALLSLLMPLKLGFPARVFLLTRTLGMPLNTSIGTLVLDGLMYNGVWALFAVVSLLFGATRYQPADFAGGIWLALALALVAIAVWNVRRRKRADASSSSSVWTQLGAHLRRVPELLREMGLMTVALSLIIMCVDVMINAAFHWALLRVVGVELSPVVVLVATSIAMLAGIASLLPSGLGSYDVTLVVLLTSFGVPAGPAVLVPVLNRVGILLMATVLGVVGGLALRLNPFRRGWLQKPAGVEESER